MNRSPAWGSWELVNRANHWTTTTTAKLIENFRSETDQHKAEVEGIASDE